MMTPELTPLSYVYGYKTKLIFSSQRFSITLQLIINSYKYFIYSSSIEQQQSMRHLKKQLIVVHGF